MITLEEFNNYNSKNSFKRIFDFKGEIAPIAEKARRNLELKMKNKVNLEQRIHYFAIGHTFKQLDTTSLFDMVLNEDLKEKKPTKFLSLQKEIFNTSFCDELQKVIVKPNNKIEYEGLIPDIRNINSHYIHNFEKLKLDVVKPAIVDFLKESFELAVIQILLKEKKISYQEYITQIDPDKELVNFLFEKFYKVEKREDQKVQLSDEAKKNLAEYEAFGNYFKNLTKSKAIDSLLFVEVKNDFDWLLYASHPVFKITSGKYLSYYACLFLLSMFLYKSEANQLISKIKGFKKNKTEAEKSKREIFSFFSKRFSSQDIDSEESHLIKFRDIIQYLNHYPTEWKPDIELESKHPVMTDKLKSKNIKMEINRSYTDYAGNERFLIYAKYKLWGEKYLGNNIIVEYDNQLFTKKELDKFHLEIDKSPLLKNAKKQLSDLEEKKDLSDKKKEKNERDIKKTKNSILEHENDPNPITEKLKKRIAKNSLFTSYGRNQDRFMLFAARYLAEMNYFGNQAQFKTYQFFNTDEQEIELKELSNKLSKKEYGKLKFHQGKLIHFTTFEKHLKRYESWDTPFVIENNAIQVKILFTSGIEKIISIQRGLMVYLLEDSLYNLTHENIQSAGKSLFENYYVIHQQEFLQSKDFLAQNKSISAVEKNAFKKLLPKRLLHNYSPAIHNHSQESNQLKSLLEKTEIAEKRYINLIEKAKLEGNYDDFIKRNKGKQFKLQFIRKAWHLMYFRESYNTLSSISGHHKSFHITKDEFNDFSRFMFAFDEVPQYKYYLRKMLEDKGFLENLEFKTLFENGNSLDNLYHKSKQAFKQWLTNKNERVFAENKYSLDNYEKHFNDQMFYINIPHFIKYLESVSKLKYDDLGLMKFNSIGNKDYLIDEYYYVDKLEKADYKQCGKLFNKLKSVKLEDALLYEMALNYLKIDKQIVPKVKKNIIEIQNTDVEFNIKNGDGINLYNLLIPFNKVDSFVGLLAHQAEQEKQFKKSSFLARIVEYLKMVKDYKDIKSLYSNFIANPSRKLLKYDELNKIYAHLVSSSIRFSNLVLGMEKYFIYKSNLLITNDNRIDYDEILPLKQYIENKRIRNRAFHFGIPDKSYSDIIIGIESKFIQNEVRPNISIDFKTLSYPLKSVCNIFLDTIHNDYFDFKVKDSKLKRQQAEDKYYNENIK